MPTRIPLWLALFGCLLAAGCASLDSIAPGTPSADVRSTRGAPFRVWPEPGGAASWEYPLGPSGRTTYMVRVGADGRVDRVDQVLGWDTFTRVAVGMPENEVEHLLGRPYSKVTYPLTASTVWSWRFLETAWGRCFLAYFNPEGRLTGTGSKDEETGDVGVVMAAPC